LNALDQSARRDLEILNSLAEGHPVSQRALAQRLGIALGLTNLYLKRLARKGYIKVTTIPPHRIVYLVTPRGFGEKARLTYEYMAYSLRLYREVRRAVQAALAPLARNGTARVALYGTGEVAELAYLTLRELGIQPAAVLGERVGQFLGYPVRDVQEVGSADYDLVVVATLGVPDGTLVRLERRGFGRGRVVTLDRRLAGRSPRGR
jgi:DNA-binding MarR family transcriptional regulator